MRGRFNGRVVGQDYTGRNTRHNGRAGMYNAVQSAFAPSLDITLANGLGPLFTFTRATTATVTEGVDGLIKSCLSGELRVQGARRVRNWLTNSENSSTWSTATGGTGTSVKTDNYATAPDGTMTAARLVATKGSGFGTVRMTIASAIPGTAIQQTCWIKSNTGSSQNVELGNVSVAYASVLVTTTWQRLTPGVQTVSAGGASSLEIGAGGAGADASVDILIWHPQLEDVTGQSNQNPSEYVSVGVLSSPYHGYFVDGVKYFSYENGNTVASKVVTEASGAAITGTIGYLAEGARTNVQKYSQDISDATYTKSGVTVASNNVVAPDGTTTADTVTENTATSVHLFYTDLGVTVASGATYTMSVFLKAGTCQYVNVGVSGTKNFYVTVDTSAGTITETGGTGTYTSSSITQAANGFYRVTVTGALAGETQYYTNVVASNSATPGAIAPSYLGTSRTYIPWGIQLEAAAFASSYIGPTTTAAVARNADVDSAPSAGILNSAAMTIAMQWAPEAASMGTVFLFGTYVDASNYTAILHDGTNIIARKRIGGANHDATKALAYAADTEYRITARFDGSNGCDIWVDGTRGTNDSTTTASQVGTTFQIGADGNSANQAFGVIPSIKIYRSGLSDAQAAAL